MTQDESVDAVDLDWVLFVAGVVEGDARPECDHHQADMQVPSASSSSSEPSAQARETPEHYNITRAAPSASEYAIKGQWYPDVWDEDPNRCEGSKRFGQRSSYPKENQLLSLHRPNRTSARIADHWTIIPSPHDTDTHKLRLLGSACWEEG